MTGSAPEPATAVMERPDRSTRGIAVAVAAAVIAIVALGGAGFGVLRWRTEQARTEAERSRLEAQTALQKKGLSEVQQETEALDRRRILLVLGTRPEALAALSAVEDDLLEHVCGSAPKGEVLDAISAATATAETDHPELPAATPEWRSALDFQAVREALDKCADSR